MFMDCKPVAIKVREAAVPALHRNGLEAEHARNHVVDGIDLVDLGMGMVYRISGETLGMFPKVRA